MSITVRKISDDELGAWIAAKDATFLRPPGGEEERAAALLADEPDVAERSWAAVDGDHVVGTTRTFALPMSVPGGEILAEAVSGVTVLATHRRRGVLTELMAVREAEALERGEPASALIAAEYPIYRRFGYGLAAETTDWTLASDTARFAVPGTGEMSAVAPAEARILGADLLERIRPGVPGMVQRPDREWDHALGLAEPVGPDSWKGRAAVARAADGTVTGFVSWRVEGDWVDGRSRATVMVQDLFGVDHAAEIRLWRFLAEIDLTQRVRAHVRPAGEVLPWLLTDGRLAHRTAQVDWLWVRILDPIAAFEARRSTWPGRVVMDVVDPRPGGGTGPAGGRFAIEAGPDGSSVVRTTASPDLTVAAPVLGTLIVGGVSVRGLSAAGGVDEHSPGALDRADALFHSPAPAWCNTMF